MSCLGCCASSFCRCKAVFTSDTLLYLLLPTFPLNWHYACQRLSTICCHIATALQSLPINAVLAITLLSVQKFESMQFCILA